MDGQFDILAAVFVQVGADQFRDWCFEAHEPQRLVDEVGPFVDKATKALGGAAADDQQQAAQVRIRRKRSRSRSRGEWGGQFRESMLLCSC
jgi:hypothetical protein